MGVIAERWVCPRCKKVVGGNQGELRNHYRIIHSGRVKVSKPELRGQAAAA